MSDKYKPNLTLDTVPVRCVKSDNKPAEKTTLCKDLAVIRIAAAYSCRGGELVVRTSLTTELFVIYEQFTKRWLVAQKQA